MKIQGVINTIANDPVHYVELSAGEGTLLTARMDTCSPIGPRAIVQQLEVFPRRHGIGTALLKCFVAEVKARYDAKTLHSDSVSSPAILMRAKLFGESALHFYDVDFPLYDELPLSVEQAVASNRRSIKHKGGLPHELDDPDNDIGILVYLDEIDTSGWLRPEMVVK